LRFKSNKLVIEKQFIELKMYLNVL